MSDTDYTREDDTPTTGAIPDQPDQYDPTAPQYGDGPQYPSDYYTKQDQPDQSDQQSQTADQTPSGDKIINDPDEYRRLMQDQQAQTTPHGDKIINDPDEYARLTQGFDPNNPDDQTSQTGAALRAFARGVGPVTGGIIGGVAAGAAAFPTTPVGQFAVGTAAGFGITTILQALENKAADVLGLSDPHALLGGEMGGLNPFNKKLQAEDDMQHATAVGLGDVASALGALRMGNAAPMVRAITAGVFGATDAASQYIQKGKVDWAVVAASGGVGAAFPGVAGQKFINAAAGKPAVPGGTNPAPDAGIPGEGGGGEPISGAGGGTHGEGETVPGGGGPATQQGGAPTQEGGNYRDRMAAKDAADEHVVDQAQDADIGGLGTAPVNSPAPKLNVGEGEKYSGTRDGQPAYAKDAAPPPETNPQGQPSQRGTPSVDLSKTGNMDPAVKGVLDNTENPGAGMGDELRQPTQEDANHYTDLINQGKQKEADAFASQFDEHLPGSPGSRLPPIENPQPQAPQPQAPQPAQQGMPFAMTKGVKQQLLDIGFTRKQVGQMTPAQAQAALAKSNVPPGVGDVTGQSTDGKYQYDTQGGTTFVRATADPAAQRAAAMKNLSPDERPPIEPDRPPGMGHNQGPAMEPEYIPTKEEVAAGEPNMDHPGEPANIPENAFHEPPADTTGLAPEARPPIEPDRPPIEADRPPETVEDVVAKHPEDGSIPDYLSRPPDTTGLGDSVAERNPQPKSLSAGATNVQNIKGIRDAWNALKNAEFWKDNPIRKIFSPQSVSQAAEDAAAVTKRVAGRQEQFDVQNAKLLEDAQRAFNQAPKEKVDEFFKNFEKGTVPPGNPLSPILPDLKTVTDRVFAELKKLPGTDKVGYAQNYFPRSRLWAQDEANQDALRNFLTAQGNSSSLKKRVFPTIQDALDWRGKNGERIRLNPDMIRPDGAVDMMRIMGTYLNGMSRFLESQNMLGQYIKEGLAAVYPDGKPPPGAVPLEGRQYLGQQAYANPDVATIYNNYWDPGIHKDEAMGSLFDTWMHAKTSMSAAKLLGGGYHFSAITVESVMGRVSIGVSQIANGQIQQGLRTIAGAPTNPYFGFRLGQDVMKEHLDPGTTKLDGEIVKALRDANFSMTPQELIAKNPELQATDPHSPSNNFFTSWSRAAINMEMQEAAARVRLAADRNLSPADTAMQTVGKTALAGGKAGLQTSKEVFNVVGKTMQTIMHPLFNQYIPMLKNGVAYQQLAARKQAWIDAGKEYTPEDLARAAAQAGDHVDNMLGMINQSNVFWNKTLKQAANAVMLSMGWNYGSARGIGGGLAKLVRQPSSVSIGHDNWDPRAAYVIAMPVVTAVIAAIYETMKTGQMPKEPPDSFGNLFTGKTGGQMPHGKGPESAILPGYQKDIYGVWNNVLNPNGTGKPLTEVYNKLAPLFQLGVETATNQDWAGKPIWDQSSKTSIGDKMVQYLQHVAQAFLPISADQVANPREGSNISAPERFMGIRPASGWMVNPTEAQKGREERAVKAWNEKKYFDKYMGR